MTNSNIICPFTPIFGKRSESFVGRLEIVSGLLSEYHNLNAPERTTLISGVRGSGKTTILTDISKTLELYDNWIVINVASTDNLLANIVGMLTKKIEERKFNSKYQVKGVTLNTPLLNVEVEKKVSGKEYAFYPELYTLVKDLTEENIIVAFIIDEVNNSSQMREFVSTYQLLIREDFNIVLLMAGLPHHVDAILNDKVLTFLRRANHIFLTLIEPYVFKVEYESIFRNAGMSFEHGALDRAYKATGGYPYLYQLIGYYIWQSNEDHITLSTVEHVIEKSKAMLYQNVYSIAFSELSKVDQLFLIKMAEEGISTSIKNIKEKMRKSSGYINNYRDKLLKTGLIKSVSHGVIAFSLPFFNEYVLECQLLV